MADQLIGIRMGRHRDLQGRSRGPWVRRLVLSLLAVIVVLALFDVFGQGSSVHVSAGTQATLMLDAPAHLRGGLMFTSRFTVQAHEPLSDARLLLENGWFEGVTFNGIAPQPGNESSHDDWTEFDYGRIEAGQSFSVWMSWQVNPTNVGRHAADVALFDGDRRVALISRTVTIAP
jgi:hypothetical protein